jgi:hypothetical protein
MKRIIRHQYDSPKQTDNRLFLSSDFGQTSSLVGQMDF